MDFTSEEAEEELSHKDQRFADLLEQFWYVHAKLPTQAQLAKEGIKPSYYQKMMSNKKFRKHLANLGLVDDPDDLRLVSWQLSEIQLAVANLMLDTMDGRSQKRKLADLKIETSTYQAWLRDPKFQEYLRIRSEALLQDNMHDVHIGLVERAKSGDSKAMSLYYALTGRFDNTQKQGLDPLTLVHSIIEIVQKVVSKPEEVEAVGQALQAVITGTVVSDSLAQEPARKELEASNPQIHTAWETTLNSENEDLKKTEGRTSFAELLENSVYGD